MATTKQETEWRVVEIDRDGDFVDCDRFCGSEREALADMCARPTPPDGIIYTVEGQRSFWNNIDGDLDDRLFFKAGVVRGSPDHPEYAKWTNRSEHWE